MRGKIAADDVRVDPSRCAQQKGTIGGADAAFATDHDGHHPSLAQLAARFAGQEPVDIIQRAGLANGGKAPEEIILRAARAGNIDIEPKRALRHPLDPCIPVAPSRARREGQAVSQRRFARNAGRRGVAGEPLPEQVAGADQPPGTIRHRNRNIGSISGSPRHGPVRRGLTRHDMRWIKAARPGHQRCDHQKSRSDSGRQRPIPDDIENKRSRQQGGQQQQRQREARRWLRQPCFSILVQPRGHDRPSPLHQHWFDMHRLRPARLLPLRRFRGPCQSSICALATCGPCDAARTSRRAHSP